MYKYVMTNHIIIKNFKFRGEKLTLITSPEMRYKDGTQAIRILTEDQVPYATLTVYAAGGAEILDEGEFLIKDWSENEAIYNHLVKEKILFPTDKVLETGFVEAKVCRLTPEE